MGCKQVQCGEMVCKKDGLCHVDTAGQYKWTMWFMWLTKGVYNHGWYTILESRTQPLFYNDGRNCLLWHPAICHQAELQFPYSSALYPATNNLEKVKYINSRNLIIVNGNKNSSRCIARGKPYRSLSRSYIINGDHRERRTYWSLHERKISTTITVS